MLKKHLVLSFFLVAAVVLSVVALPARAQTASHARTASHSVNFTDNFSSGSLDRWQFPYPQDWAIQKEGSTSYLHMVRMRDAQNPTHPIQFALLKGVNVGNFTFQARVRRQSGQKSVIMVFDYVDPMHFYYAHLSGDPGVNHPVHNGVFLVDGAPRRRIAGSESAAALPDFNWHTVRLERNVHTGSIKIFVDNSPRPLFSVVDRTFLCGRVGFGSFDEKGDFTSIKLTSHDAACTPHAGGTQMAGNQ